MPDGKDVHVQQRSERPENECDPADCESVRRHKERRGMAFEMEAFER